MSTKNDPQTKQPVKASVRRQVLADNGIEDKERQDELLFDMIQKGTVVDDEGLGDELSTTPLTEAFNTLDAVLADAIQKGGAADAWWNNDPYIDPESSQLVRDIAVATAAELQKGGSAPTEYGIAMGTVQKAMASAIVGLMEASNENARTNREILARLDRMEKGGTAPARQAGFQAVGLDQFNQDYEVEHPGGQGGGQSMGFDPDLALAFAEDKLQKGGLSAAEESNFRRLVTMAESGLDFSEDSDIPRYVELDETEALAKSLGFVNTVSA